MPNRLAVEAGRFVNILIAAVVLLFAVSLALSGTFFLMVVVAAIAGGLLGGGAIYLRSNRGLGATEVGERGPEYAGKVGLINMAHIPVIGVGGLGILAMAIVVGLVLPQGRQLLGWGVGGAILGAGAILAWRHYHGGTPFTEDQGETLHLR